jgi:hypothetical protein
MVYMNHGLAVALLIAATLIAAVALYRARIPVLTFGAGKASIFLGWILLVCKTVSSLLYGYIGAVLALFGSAKAQIRMALVLVACLLVYPLLRLNDMVDTEELVRIAEEWTDEERAQSLEFRLVNEEILFERALERPVFGWGGFARACIYDIYTGDEISTRDGAWIITLGERGVAGYVLAFGLLALPILLARRRIAKVKAPIDRALFGAVTLLVGIHAFDFIPNGRYSYLGHLLAGALYGLARGLPLELPIARHRPKRLTPAGKKKEKKVRVDDLIDVPAPPPVHAPPPPAAVSIAYTVRVG